MVETGLSSLHKSYTIKIQFSCHGLLGKSGFKDLLSQLKNAQMKWENQFGWINQPLVLTFKASEEEAQTVNDRLPLGLIVSGHWAD